MLLFGTLAVTLAGCQIFENLTEPVVDVLQRTISLTMTPSSLPPGGGDIEIEATVRVGDAPEAEIMVSFSATVGYFPNGDTAMTDSDGKARVTLRTTATAEVTAAIKAAGVVLTESNAGQVEVEQDEGEPSTGRVKFEVEFLPKPAELNEPVRIKVTATTADGKAAEGALKVEFGDGKSTRIPDFKRRATVEHTYRDASVFDIVTSLFTGGGEVSSKTSSLRVNDTTETRISLSAATLLTYAREPLSFRIALDQARLAQASGVVRVDWGDGRSTNIGEIAGGTSVEHMFRDPGSYRVVATVTTPNGRGGRSDVRIRVEPRLTAEIDLTADVGFVQQPTTFTAVASLSNGAAPNGTATLRYGDGASVTGALTRGRASATHAYVNEGTYTARIDFRDEDSRTASATLRVVIKAEDLGGDDNGGGGDSGGGGSGGGGGDSGGGDGGGGGGQDALDLSQVVFLNHDISNWATTSTLGSVSISAGQICMPHTKAGKWPTARAPASGVTIEASTWIIANVGGTWYAAIFEWQPVGGICKSLGSKPPATTVASQMKSHVKFKPLTSWTPKSGEVVYVMVSALAWPGFVPVLTQERTQVVKAVWP